NTGCVGEGEPLVIIDLDGGGHVQLAPTMEGEGRVLVGAGRIMSTRTGGQLHQTLQVCVHRLAVGHDDGRLGNADRTRRRVGARGTLRAPVGHARWFRRKSRASPDSYASALQPPHRSGMTRYIIISQR